MSKKIRCIYCLENKKKTEFNKDHVIPRCFGAFEPDNLTLLNTVCSSCNQYLGDNLEINLGRDSLEGVTRYNYKIFPGGKTRFRRLIFKIEREGLLKGMLVSPKAQLLDGLPEIELLDQVGFFSIKTEQYEYFPDFNIPEKDQLENDGYSFSDKEIRVIGDFDRLQGMLTRKGYPANFLREEVLFISPDEKKNIPVVIKARIDRTIARGMAKIAFNYLAHVISKDFVVGRDFNKIRNFIRYNDGNFDDLFRIEKKPILKKEIEQRRWILDGHLIVVNWYKDDLVCKLSIFNRIIQMTYVIQLSNRYSGIWIPICTGHYFDVLSNKISRLYKIERLIIP